MFEKKYRFLIEKERIPTIKAHWLRDLNKKLISALSNSLVDYIPELTALKPGESVEVEIKIKGRK